MPRKPTVKDFADMRLRHHYPVTWARLKAEHDRERKAVLNMGRYLYHSKRAMDRERYITAFFGIPSSWAAIESASIYFNVAEHKPA